MKNVPFEFRQDLRHYCLLREHIRSLPRFLQVAKCHFSLLCNNEHFHPYFAVIFFKMKSASFSVVYTKQIWPRFLALAIFFLVYPLRDHVTSISFAETPVGLRGLCGGERASIVSKVYYYLYILFAGAITMTKWLTRKRAAVSERTILLMVMITNKLMTTRKTILVEKAPQVVQKTMKCPHKWKRSTLKIITATKWLLFFMLYLLPILNLSQILETKFTWGLEEKCLEIFWIMLWRWSISGKLRVIDNVDRRTWRKISVSLLKF